MLRFWKQPEEEETTYWLSYSDMLAALLLVFVLIISFTMLQARRQYEEKEAELEKQRIATEEQQKTLESQQLMLEDQQKVMDAQQEKLDAVVGIRSNLIEALADEFEGTDLKVIVDSKTGAIVLDSSILFDFGKYDIKPSGQDFLKEFLPRYISVLLKPGFREYVSEIIIEGHTDTVGTYMNNLELSQERALSVAQFCLDDENDVLSPAELEELKPIITANGRSFSDPIYDTTGEVDSDASRRVEFKFRLKDEEMIDEMIEILNEQ